MLGLLACFLFLSIELPVYSIKNQLKTSRRTWSEVSFAVEADDAVFLSSHQNLISNFHVQSLRIQTGY